jgi:hypothetical protein
VVPVGGNCLLGKGLRLDLGMGLRTDRYSVLWDRRLLWRWILAWRRLHRHFILGCWCTVNWIDHQYLPLHTTYRLAKKKL